MAQRTGASFRAGTDETELLILNSSFMSLLGISIIYLYIQSPCVARRRMAPELKWAVYVYVRVWCGFWAEQLYK